MGAGNDFGGRRVVEGGAIRIQREGALGGEKKFSPPPATMLILGYADLRGASPQK